MKEVEPSYGRELGGTKPSNGREDPDETGVEGRVIREGGFQDNGRDFKFYLTMNPRRDFRWSLGRREQMGTPVSYDSCCCCFLT